MTKTIDSFKISVQSGQIYQGEIVVMLGENGTGKTTLFKMLIGALKPDDETIEMPKLNVSYKPQIIYPKFEGTVKDLLYKNVANLWENARFKTEVFDPLGIE